MLDVSYNLVDTLECGITPAARSFGSRLGALQWLSLAYNRLERLPAQCFRHLGVLQKLNLRANRITSVAQNAFAGLSVLEFLDLSSNPIVQVDAGMFAGLDALTSLWLENACVGALPVGPSIGSVIPRLQRLHMQSNKLSALLEGMLTEMPGLREVDVSRNKIGVDIACVSVTTWTFFWEHQLSCVEIESVTVTTPTYWECASHFMLQPHAN